MNSMDDEHNILVVSDLHLSGGLDPGTGKTSRLEDFFRDDAFARFLRYHESIKDQPRFGGRPWLLILNGDIFDFLQVVSLPHDGRLLEVIKGGDDASCLTDHERAYGLGTTALESEWKLKQIARGHQRFFAALGSFVARGNQIVVIRGNHDVELHWTEVQDRFVVEARRAHVRQWLREGGSPPAKREAYAERIRFPPWFYHDPDRIYVEHGCQYDALNNFRDVLNPVLPDDPQRIELPRGSLFVRYLFNRIEDVHPFADNVKPPTRYLSWAFRKSPLKTLGLLIARGWTFLRALWLAGQKARVSTAEEGAESQESAAAGNLPLPPQVTSELAALAERSVRSAWQEWIGSLTQSLVSLLSALIIGAFSILAAVTLVLDTGPVWLAAAYAAAALVAGLLRYALREGFAYLLQRSDLLKAAAGVERVLASNHRVRIITMGHNHQPTLHRLHDAWYVNTGAWVRLYQREGPVEGREVLTFLRVAETQRGAPELLRWDDAAGAPTRLVIRVDENA
jgi:UDP-2,3-diacylglucosamine pyrophosphatase LpxH